MLNPTSLYYGGYFKVYLKLFSSLMSALLMSYAHFQAEMKFPKKYPYEPPEFKFTRPLWHPNIYTDGKLCISILHQPGEDEMSGELASVI